MRLQLAWVVGPLPPLLLLQLAIPAAASFASDTFANKTLSDIFWELKNISPDTTRHVRTGHQNFTACCLLAVNESLTVANDGLDFTPGHQGWITFGNQSDDGNATVFYDYYLQGQFPCTAVYDEQHPDGAPVVKVTYSWIEGHCPGWALNSPGNFNAWLQPLSSFLIPAVVFCLSVPRRRKLELSFLFSAIQNNIILKRLCVMVDTLLALVIVSFDTVAWLCVCFAFAGPMILSGLYESMLDSTLLKHLEHEVKKNRLTLDMRCRCLMITLIGNLDLDLDTNNSNAGPFASPWQYMEHLFYDLRLYDPDNKGSYSPRQYPKHSDCGMSQSCSRTDHIEQPHVRNEEVKLAILRTKTRLRSMLRCQGSFGSMVGAPVIFYLGGFVFTLLQSMVSLGDKDIAIGLAFGQWYMTIPHIAIVSGILLAGNNPDIFEGVIAVEQEFLNKGCTFLGFSYALAYPSCFKVAWLWGRGYTKKKWIDKLIATYRLQPHVHGGSNENLNKDMLELEKATTLPFWQWLILLLLTFLLVGLPYVLAFLTAYYTPEVGLSCRSLTFTIYISVQTCQIFLWLWAYSGPTSAFGSCRLNCFRKDGWLDRNDFFKPASPFWLNNRKPGSQNPKKLLCWNLLWNILYYIGWIGTGTIGVVAAIAGTLMQLMGVYSANICAVTTNYWRLHKNKITEMPMVSLNSPDMIHGASRIWTRCAITAILFMTVVAIIGWAYQRNQRELFLDLVEGIDNNERDDSKRSHVHNIQPAPSSQTRPTNSNYSAQTLAAGSVAAVSSTNMPVHATPTYGNTNPP